jgi:cellulose synthase/poly-beta-1,6-N-acetylglucosamine synthase-like glycosyltransferase
MSDQPWHIAVLIPARNEEILLPRCLKSVLEACALLPISVTIDVVVVCDSSTDLTFQIAKQMLSNHGTVVTTEAGIVGQARALATQVALQRYSGQTRRCWLANTDADCCVPKSWLLDQLLLAEEGLETVAGIVDVDSFEEHEMGTELRFRNKYIIHPDGSHPHIHGANLGFRADVYLRSGGWKGLATAEDHDLWNRLIKTATRRISTATVKVLTSGRRTGRAPRGFADTLAGRNEAAA